ncbi:MAG: metal-sensitive transcriptional regulator [Actinobacteria bacterium]|nr:metal-sensitive transcriptional regulator [Actinomycetota bacterium]
MDATEQELEQELRRQSDVEQVVNRLRRIEGQVRGLQRMLEDGRDCEAILTQLAAARSALDRVGMFLISHRMKECLEGAGQHVSQEAMEAAFEVFLKYASLGRKA